MAAIAPVADVGRQQGDAVVVTEEPDPAGRLALAAAEVGETGCNQDLLLPVGVEVEQRDLRLAAAAADVERSELRPQAGHQALRCVAGRREVLGPLPTPRGDVDALEEGRDHLAQLVQHHVGVVARFGKRVRAHAQQQLLVGLAGAVDADVRQRGRRQKPAQRVERLGAGRLAVDEVAVAGLLGKALGHPGLHLRQERAVRVEHPVHLADEAGAVWRVEDLGRAEVAVLPVLEPLVVRDVARRLLEVRHEAPPLEHLRQHVRGLLAGEVDTTELGHRVVAVLDEDLLVELLRPARVRRSRRRWRRPRCRARPTNSSRKSRRRLLGERE